MWGESPDKLWSGGFLSFCIQRCALLIATVLCLCLLSFLFGVAGLRLEREVGEGCYTAVWGKLGSGGVMEGGVATLGSP